MDPNCSGTGTCPWGPGVDPYSLSAFKQYPLPNGYSAGDGLNTASYTWSAPAPASLNTYITRVDYALSNNNWLFIRGNLQNDQRAWRAAISRTAGQFRPTPATAKDWP